MRTEPRGRRSIQGVPMRVIRPASSNHAMAHAAPNAQPAMTSVAQ